MGYFFQKWWRGWLFLAIALALAAAPLLTWAGRHSLPSLPTRPSSLLTPMPGYTGSAACSSCHAAQANNWAASHHAQAMAPATPAAVKGDFSGVRIAAAGATAHFFHRGESFMAETEGPDGRPATFQISYTFGVDPLQQYLVSFPDGRLQALPWAWDSRPAAQGGQRWFNLNQNHLIHAEDPLFWSGRQQTWNFMCAECHSTAVRKNYDATSNTYHTTMSEISVGCESCHGPGAAHIAWAHGPRTAAIANHGFPTIPAKRPTPDWRPNPSTGSPDHGVSRPAGDEVELCAHCHSRRTELAEGWLPGQDLTQTHLPRLLEAGLFTDDGQMQDEVFNDQSFKQSLMYARGVVCSDCHDPHAGGLKQAGATVCAQCHMPARFDTPAHSGHAPGPTAPTCISCHMPVRTYMAVDQRHDHSFRIPRPDISARIGTPNACNDCHRDKNAQWAADAVQAWHGPTRHGLQNWAEAIHAARAGDPAARAPLLALAADASVPAIARATILTEVQQFVSRATLAATTTALTDPDPLVRIAALRGLADQTLEARWQLANALLADKVAAVRMEAALLLADQPSAGLPPEAASRLQAAATAYMAAQRLNADRPEARAALGSFLRRQGDETGAQAQFQAGLKLAPDDAALLVDLADLYRAEWREPDAAAILRHATEVAPTEAATHYALGLSLIRQRNYAAALPQLARAASLAPQTARFAAVYAIALQSADHQDDARRVITQALQLHPYDVGLLRMALNDATKDGDRDAAGRLAAVLARVRPDDGN